MPDAESLAAAASAATPPQTAFQGLLTGVNGVVSVVANWIQVGEFVVDVLENALSSSPDLVGILEGIQQGVQDLLQGQLAAGIQIDMLALTGLVSTAQDRLDALLDSPDWQSDPTIDEAQFFAAAQDAAFAFAEPAYWSRPYVSGVTFFEQTGDAYVSNANQPPLLQQEGVSFVYDPQLCFPAFASAIAIFTSVVSIFHSTDSDYIKPYCTDLATILYTNYQAAVQGLIMVPVPSYSAVQDLGSIANSLALQSPYSPDSGADFADWVAELESASQGDGERWGGDQWHAMIGVFDMYSVFGSPTPGGPYYGTGFPCPAMSDPGLLSPSRFIFRGATNGGNIVDQFPAFFDFLAYDATVPGEAGAYPYAYGWFFVRMALGNLSRFKALYLTKGYDKIWSLVQKLRAISSGQHGTPVYGYPPTPSHEVSDLNAHWSVAAVSGIFDAMPFQYVEWESPRDAPKYFPGTEPVSVEQVIQRLLTVLDNATNTPNEESPVLATTHPRPLSLRGTLSAVAL